MSTYLDQFQITPLAIAWPDKHQDPYALWALQTDFRAFKRRNKLASELTFLLELDHPYVHTFPFAVAASDLTLGALIIQIAGVELRLPLVYTQRPFHFITLRLWIDGLSNATLRAVVTALMNIAGVKRLQSGFQRPGYDCPAPSEIYVPPILMPSPPSTATPAVVLGVVEDACPFGHAATLQDDQSTRIVSLWDQSNVAPPQAPWTCPATFPYGQQLTREALNGLLAQFRLDDDIDEEAMYANPHVYMPDLMRRSSHGAAVIDLLAGNTPLLGVGTPDDGTPAPLTAGQLAADELLRKAPIVVVRLPREQTMISSGRWLAVNAVDALHRIMGEARGLGAPSPAPPPPLVVNVSYGAIAGSHDGTSMIESAVDELCDGYENMAVVVAAGNAHGTVHDCDALGPAAVLAGGVHATHDLPPGKAVILTLQLPADKPFETYVEIWFSDPAKQPGADQWLAQDEVAVTVAGPDGVIRCGVLPGMACYMPANGAQTVAGLVFVKKASQSLHRSMALLVLAATRLHADFVNATAGRWTITLVNLRQPGSAGARDLSVQAWVERDDTTFGIDRPQSARLVPNDDGAAGHLNDQNIFSTLAGGQCTLSAGALLQPRDELGHSAASAYTAAGPAVDKGPTMSAVADAGFALSGIRVAGSRSGMVLRANGTSMAAPQVARYVALRLASGEKLAQIRQSLPPGPRDARRGPKVP